MSNHWKQFDESSLDEEGEELDEPWSSDSASDSGDLSDIMNWHVHDMSCVNNGDVPLQTTQRRISLFPKKTENYFDSDGV